MPSPQARAVPEFGGVQEAVVENYNDIHLKWGAGRDDATAPSQLVYRIYLGETRQNEALPVRIDEPYATTLPGATSFWLYDFPVGRYRFVVRAVDRDGNEDQNRASVAAVVGDRTAPTFAGVYGAWATTSHDVFVEWKAATDDVTPPEWISYELYVGHAPDELFDQEPLLPLQGATSHHLAGGSIPRKGGVEDSARIWVGVRARDEAGNGEKNERITSLVPPENIPPRFAGLSQISPHEDGVQLFWKRAQDNLTPQADLIYYIYRSEESGEHNFLSPDGVTGPGVNSIVLSDLLPETKYHFVVQAVDEAGNRDGNHVERAFVTREADQTAPTFSGVLGASSITPRSATLSWNVASDDRTASERIVYDIYLSKKSHQQDFQAGPTATSMPGRSTWTVFGLSPDTQYFSLVRARDGADNRDENEIELSFSTPPATDDDSDPPPASGLSVEPVPSRPDWLRVTWASESDDSTTFRGHVCVATDAEQCEGEAFFDSLNVSGAFGSSSVIVDGLQSRGLYRIAVRLEDENGNLTSAGSFTRGTTSTSYRDDVLPIFERRCNQCHDYQYGTIVNVQSTFEAMPLVRPDSPETSYLFRTLRPSGDTMAPFSEHEPARHDADRMPSDGTPYLEPELESTLLDWIRQGAFEN